MSKTSPPVAPKRNDWGLFVREEIIKSLWTLVAVIFLGEGFVMTCGRINTVSISGYVWYCNIGPLIVATVSALESGFNSSHKNRPQGLKAGFIAGAIIFTILAGGIFGAMHAHEHRVILHCFAIYFFAAAITHVASKLTSLIKR